MVWKKGECGNPKGMKPLLGRPMTSAERAKKWRDAHPERVVKDKERERESKWMLRLEVLEKYGGKCACCGYSDLERKLHGKGFLQIDHIAGGGRKHLKDPSLSIGFYPWLKRNGFPEGFRVLCAGCNCSMEANEPKCLLHQEKL